MAFEIELEKGAASVVTTEEGAKVTVDEKVFNAILSADRPEIYRISDETGSKTLHVVPAKDGIWVWCDGKARLVREISGKRRSGDAAIPDIVTPTMPGVVVRIAVSVGDDVTKGQELVVVSAMKMESSLNAPYDGTVTTISVEEGQQVSPGEVLVEIESNEKEDSNE